MKKILVIEDEALIRDQIIELLSYEGFHVISAINGRDGLEMARETLPDLVISDVLMPELSGLEVLQELRRDPATSAIPFILLTVKDSRNDIRLAMNIGADDYLTKPFTSQELLAVIRIRLERHEAIWKKLNDLRLNINLALPHELRTPLTTICGFARLIRDNAASLGIAQLIEMGDIILHNSSHLQSLIENYLLYTQTELFSLDREKRKKLLLSEIENQNEVITAAAEEKSGQYQREADFVLKIKKKPLFKVRIGEKHLRKIIIELLDNAFKFSKNGTPVKLKTEYDPDYFILTISDSGRGISPEQMANIGAYIQFDRIQYEQSGTGLGLIIAKRLVETYGGKFDIVSKHKQNTTVTVKLKLAKAE